MDRAASWWNRRLPNADRLLPSPPATEDFKKDLLDCRACVSLAGHPGSKDILCAPRLPTGRKVRPALAIVGQNPPEQEERRLHGAWMLHYSDAFKKGPAERLVADLLQYLHFTPAEVYATQTVKCATNCNFTPHRDLTHLCARTFLLREVKEVQPNILLVFGREPIQLFVERGWVQGEPQSFRIYEEQGPSPHSTYRWEHVISAPHPSHVGRFIKPVEAWMKAIYDAYYCSTFSNLTAPPYADWK